MTHLPLRLRQFWHGLAMNGRSAYIRAWIFRLSVSFLVCPDILSIFPIEDLHPSRLKRPENLIKFGHKHVHGRVDMMVYKAIAHVLARSTPESNLYSEEEAYMDSLDGFNVSDTTGFIAVQGMRLKMYGAVKIQWGEPLARD